MWEQSAPLVEIRLADLPKSGGAPPGTTCRDTPEILSSSVDAATKNNWLFVDATGEHLIILKSKSIGLRCIENLIYDYLCNVRPF